MPLFNTPIGFQDNPYQDIWLTAGSYIRFGDGSQSIQHDSGEEWFRSSQKFVFAANINLEGTDIQDVGNILPFTDATSNIGADDFGFASLRLSGLAFIQWGVNSKLQGYDAGLGDGSGLEFDGELKLTSSDLIPSRLLALDSDGIVSTHIDTSDLALSVSEVYGTGGLLLGNPILTYFPSITLVGGAGNTVPVYTTKTARADRIGNRMFVDVIFSGDGGAEGAGTGQMNIELPAAVSSTAVSQHIGIVGRALNAAAYVSLGGAISASGTTIALTQGTNDTAFTGAGQNNTTRKIELHFEYQVD